MSSDQSTPKRLTPIGTFDTFALGINGVIGSGIFFLPSIGDKLLGPAAVLATLLAGVLAWMIASAFGDVSVFYRRNGGAYIYTRDNFGAGPGFVVGWMTWLVAVTSWGALLNALFLALSGLSGTFSDPTIRSLGMSLLVVLLVVFNIRGLRLGASVSTTLTVLKATPLVILAVIGLPEIDLAYFVPFSPHGWNGFADATLLILYAYVGFESLVVPSAEIQNAPKTMPRLLPNLLVSVTVLYLILQMVCISSLSDLGGRDNPIAESAQVLLGDTLGAVFLWVSVVSVLGVNAGTALVTPRRLAALADEGDAPKVLGRRHSRYDTPAVAVALTGLAALLFALAGSFKELALMSVVARFVQYLPTCWLSLRGVGGGELNINLSGRFKAGIALLVSLALLVVADREKLFAGGVGVGALSLVYLFVAHKRTHSK